MAKILLVDDDNHIRTTLSGFFHTPADDFVAVSCGQDALALLRSERFDVVVTDLFMGNGDGIELISNIRTIDPLVPIILITGGGKIFPQGSPNLANLTATALVLGACHVLYKPFRRQTFIALIDQALSRDEQARGVVVPAIAPCQCRQAAPSGQAQP